MFSWYIAISLCILYMTLDALYVICTLEMTRLNPMRASLAVVAIYGLSAIGIMQYTENHYYILSILIGSFIGTYFVVLYERNKQKKK